MKLIQKIKPFKSPTDALISYGREGNFILGFNYGIGFIKFVIKGWKIKVSILRY